ncbi:MAG TPA: bifunctional precorrin-2 dehydrogenase/sirohydrochlorin ferrochelatase [Candidatus Acidoferrales bacterium]|nr:bifunctional precorrin-2 dehydrogenase/sirohydrochlorin ferrochelatase [Candidatus Acidoferrales bacterium]
MNLFPIFLKMSKRQCLVVGAGKIAEEKIEGLLPTGADIHVVAPKATPRIRALAQDKRINWQRRAFRASDLRRAFVVVAATSSTALHEKIYREARRQKVLCNVVDDPVHCDFYYGSVVRRGALQIAISTAGKSPALAQRIRKMLEQQFGPEYEEWVDALGQARDRLFSRKMDPEERKRLLHILASAEMFDDFAQRKL